jgi:large subunit ribosomal protein L25
MAATKSETTKLSIEPREAAHSRETRRLRRAGRVPGVLYGLGQDCVSFSVDARELRHALHGSGAVIELTGVEGAGATAAVLKDAQRHPVRGDVLHVDMVRVDLNVKIQAPVPLHLHGADDSPGHRDGGVLEQVTREVTVEALPNDIPEELVLDVSAMEINDTFTLDQVKPPTGVEIVDDLETVVANLSPPRLESDLDELETETAVVGEGAGEAEGSDDDAGADEVPADAGDGAESGGE